MVRSAGVVAREQRGELHNTVGVGLLDATQCRVVQVRQVGRVTVAVRVNSGVDTSCVAVELGVSICFDKQIIVIKERKVQ